MVPLRGIFESLGARVDWNESQQSISATRGNTEVQLAIGNQNATVNGRNVYLDTPAMILHGSTMVPLRFVSESLGADVKWFDATQTVAISTGTGGQYYPQTTSQVMPDRRMCNLVASIALYPDPLLAIMLPASTYEDQIIIAERMNLGNNEQEIDRQNWDVSVKALAHYPYLLRRMAEDPNWTVSLGQAYVEHPQEIMYATQTLRVQCRANGVLTTTREQRIYMDGEYVRIVPAQAATIYVPQYDPNVVYVKERPAHATVLLAFGAGLVIGAWLSNDTDWAHHRVYNHGWQGSGWVASSRPHITINNTYITNVNKTVIVNNHITQQTVNQSRVKQYTLPTTFTPNHQAAPHPSMPILKSTQQMSGNKMGNQGHPAAISPSQRAPQLTGNRSGKQQGSQGHQAVTNPPKPAPQMSGKKMPGNMVGNQGHPAAKSPPQRAPQLTGKKSGNQQGSQGHQAVTRPSKPAPQMSGKKMPGNTVGNQGHPTVKSPSQRAPQLTGKRSGNQQGSQGHQAVTRPPKSVPQMSGKKMPGNTVGNQGHPAAKSQSQRAPQLTGNRAGNQQGSPGHQAVTRPSKPAPQMSGNRMPGNKVGSQGHQAAQSQPKPTQQISGNKAPGNQMGSRGNRPTGKDITKHDDKKENGR